MFPTVNEVVFRVYIKKERTKEDAMSTQWSRHEWIQIGQLKYANQQMAAAVSANDHERTNGKGYIFEEENEEEEEEV